MADGTDAPVNGQRRLPFFRRASPDRPVAHRRQSTVHWHRALRSLLYLIAWIFLVLVVIGNVANKPVLRSTYFLYLDLSNIIPLSVPNAVLINSIARSIGLHDFYQVGLWGFCEGYNDEGITACSKPKTLYAFNPVDIILNELLAGASSMFYFSLLSLRLESSIEANRSSNSRPAQRHPRTSSPGKSCITLDVRPLHCSRSLKFCHDFPQPLCCFLATPAVHQVMGLWWPGYTLGKPTPPTSHICPLSCIPLPDSSFLRCASLDCRLRCRNSHVHHLCQRLHQCRPQPQHQGTRRQADAGVYVDCFRFQPDRIHRPVRLLLCVVLWWSQGSEAAQGSGN